jgi:recombination DNA repair RAD52 pathway protein
VSALTDKQQEVLLRDLHPSRVAILDGMSHLETWDVRAHLTRIFGFGGWDEVDAGPGTVCLYAEKTTTRAGKDAWKVAYRATRRLTVRDQYGQTLCEYEATAVGESVMPEFKRGDAHDMAIKTAESQALKRCAINLGTQFGLSLYDNGRTADVVRQVLVPENFVRPEVVTLAGAVE